MFRIILMPLLVTGLIAMLAVPPLAEDRGEPTIVKVYKSPG